MKYANTYSSTDTRSFDSGLMQYMHLIYKQMGIALAVSALIAFIFGSSPALMGMVFANPLISIIVQLAPLIFTFYFYKNIWSCTPEKAKGMLYTFAALMGISISTIFIAYTKESIAQMFLVTAITFGSMSLYGYTTKKDLTSLSSFLMMGLIGMLIASLVNIFLRSSAMGFVISFVGVIVFTLFTAYDVQNLKRSYSYVGSSNIAENLAVIGALQLYLDFINLFLSLLSLFGNNRE